MIKIFSIILFLSLSFSMLGAFAQDKAKRKDLTKREIARREMHSRDSLMRSLNKSDTSISSLLQRIEQYTTTFNQIKNTLGQGLDTTEVSEQLPPIVRRLDKINSVANTHKSSTLRYLFVLRDNLDHIQNDLDGWQSDMSIVNTKLVQNETDLIKFPKDTVLKTIPSDSVVRSTFFGQLRGVKLLWHKADSLNRNALLKVNLLQDKIAVSYTRTLDESDQIDTKIKNFAIRAEAGEFAPVWYADPRYDAFKAPMVSTIKLNKLLFNYFIRSETSTHVVSVLFFILVMIWIIYTRRQIVKNHDDPQTILAKAPYIWKMAIPAALIAGTAIVPYFYSHPPVVFLEVLLGISIILALILSRSQVTKKTFEFLLLLFVIAVAYGISNLFIEITNIDRYLILVLSVASIIAAAKFYKHIKQQPDSDLPNTALILKIFIGLQLLSLLLNISGRFSLAKIVGVTAVFNLWYLLILYVVVNTIIQVLFLQFQIKRSDRSIINWIDYDLVQKKFKSTLLTAASLLWIFILLQNLNIDDWASDHINSLLDSSHSIGGAAFTFGGFVIFIFVIWLSSIASKVISYLYDVSAQRVTDLSVYKRKNRTSALIIRIGVFSVGFMLAVAASGFPLDKLTIIISAFGVGIGFGLQNIVNNLVSGLILAFEKPIQIGDVIEVDGHTGTMKEIGIRSSRVVTGDGSEVIIPNGDLISHQVVNWTLSNSNRQIELHVITAYGVDIDKTKKLLKDLLTNRNDIMTSPAPAVFLNNLSQSAVEFKVQFWEADISTTGELKSTVLTEIYAALNKQGIPLPSSQKDFYLHFPEGIPLTNKETQATEAEKKPLEAGIKGNPGKKDQ